MSANFLRKRAIVIFSDDESENADDWPVSPSKRRSGAGFYKELLNNKQPIAAPNFVDLASQDKDEEEQEQEQDHREESESEPLKKPLTRRSSMRSKIITPQALLESPTSSSSPSPPPFAVVCPDTLTPPRTPTRRTTRHQKAEANGAVGAENVVPLPPATPKKAGGLPTPKTPSRTLSSRSVEKDIVTQNHSTGLTPAMNKMMKPSSKENANTASGASANAKEKKAARETPDENVVENDNSRIKGYSTPKRIQKTKSLLGASDASSSATCKTSTSSSTSPTASTSCNSSTSSKTLVYYQDAKTLFRRTTEPHRLVGRAAEREVIRAFCQDHVLTPRAGSLYISGQPGTGKTALLREILRELEPEMQEVAHEIKTVVVNCMTIKDPKLVYGKLLEEFGYEIEGKDKEDLVKTVESLVLESNKKKIMFVVVLDEIDQLLTKDQDVLYKLFQWSSLQGSKLTLFGIANALDMTDRFLPRLKARNCEPQLLNFNPYQVAEIRAIIMDRLFSLEDNAADAGNKDGNNKDGKDEMTGKPRVAPLMQRPAIELCARKVAAATGDLRKALDICRQTIEMVEMEAKKKERLEKQQQQQSGNSPLSEIRLANLENQAAGGGAKADRLVVRGRQAGSVLDLSSHAGSGGGTASGSPLTLQDAPKVTVDHVKRALASAFGSPMMQKMKQLNVHQKIVLSVLVMKIQAGRTVDCEVGKVFDHYTTTCRSSNKIGAVNRGEFQDLINMLEANGLVTLSKAREERLKKIGLVPRESEVVEAIKGQDILDTILAKSGVKVDNAPDL